ncbi:MAG: hypothetical protein MUC69_00040 [Gemmatimonadales bacterium]|jgi:hypothetical protein|nr:hypothetical protein [Gemmatimonadales bacterium]
MPGRFRLTGPKGAGRVLPSVEALLDALEAGRLAPADFVFDLEAQCWVRAKDHPELQRAWAERQRFRPLDDRTPLARVPEPAPAFPALDDAGVTPAHGTPDLGDLAARRAALRASRAGRDAPVPRPDPYLGAERLVRSTALVLLLLVLGLMGWGVVGLASGASRMVQLGLPGWR